MPSDYRERSFDHEEALRTAMDDLQARLWTSLPGTVVSVDMQKQTMVVQPAIKSIIRKPDGTSEAVSLPQLHDVPMQFPGGGGALMTFPVKPGDETLVIFSSRAPDAWQQSGGEQKQVGAEMHSLSGGFGLMGFKSNPEAGKVDSPSSDAIELRSVDGKHRLALNPGSGFKMSSEGVSMVMTKDGVAFTGGTITHNGKSIDNSHVHTGVTPGGGNTGVPA